MFRTMSKPVDLRALLVNSFAMGSKPTIATFPELPTAVLFVRVAVGALLGLALGLMRASGLLLALAAALAVAAFGYYFYAVFLGADAASYGADDGASAVSGADAAAKPAAAAAAAKPAVSLQAAGIPEGLAALLLCWGALAAR